MKTKADYWKGKYLEILKELEDNHHETWMKIVNKKLDNIEEALDKGMSEIK